MPTKVSLLPMIMKSLKTPGSMGKMAKTLAPVVAYDMALKPLIEDAISTGSGFSAPPVQLPSLGGLSAEDQKVLQELFGENKSIAENLLDPNVSKEEQLAGIVGGGIDNPLVQPTTKPPSDVDLKDVDDPREYIGQLIRDGKRLTPEDVKTLIKAFPRFGDEDQYDTKHICMWTDKTLQGYVDHIKNYKYKYRDEAKQLDPSIDTNTDHIGPMAQAIEKVNPACIITDPKTGYKSVDTGRLALMNAGALAALARELGERKDI